MGTHKSYVSVAPKKTSAQRRRQNKASKAKEALRASKVDEKAGGKAKAAGNTL